MGVQITNISVVYKNQFIIGIFTACTTCFNPLSATTQYPKCCNTSKNDCNNFLFHLLYYLPVIVFETYYIGVSYCLPVGKFSYLTITNRYNIFSKFSIIHTDCSESTRSGSLIYPICKKGSHPLIGNDLISYCS